MADDLIQDQTFQDNQHQGGQPQDEEEIRNKKISDLEARIIELENSWKRALADYKNLQKRAEEEKEQVVNFANLVLISQLLGVLDNLESVERHSEDLGLKLTIKEFRQILKEQGLEEIDVKGNNFDAHTMEAVEMVEGGEGKVMEIFQKGYRLKDKIIRPARVKVGKKGN